MNMTELLGRVVDFNEADAIATKAELSSIRRRRASTIEAFKTFRSQTDTFEKHVVGDYDASEAECLARLARIEAQPKPEPEQSTVIPMHQAAE